MQWALVLIPARKLFRHVATLKFLLPVPTHTKNWLLWQISDKKFFFENCGYFSKKIPLKLVAHRFTLKTHFISTAPVDVLEGILSSALEEGDIGSLYYFISMHFKKNFNTKKNYRRLFCFKGRCSNGIFFIPWDDRWDFFIDGKHFRFSCRDHLIYYWAHQKQAL